MAIKHCSQIYMVVSPSRIAYHLSSSTTCPLLSSNSLSLSCIGSAMNAEEVLKLFDSDWFEREILTSKRAPQISDPEVKNSPETLKISRMPSRHVRSLSDQLSSNLDSPSPKSVLLSHTLQTILSGKESTEESPKIKTEKRVSAERIRVDGRRKKINGTSKSLSDLEFEELKGFIDLGFVFSEEDQKNSSLASIIPGLQRLGKSDEEKRDSEEEHLVERPYLSEAWGVVDRRKEVINPLIDWRVLALGTEIDMKDQIRHWAHTVVSTVR